MKHVLKTGTLAYMDTAGAGLVPCKVLAIYESIEIHSLGVYGQYLATVLVTADRYAYKRGTEHKANPRWIIPRGAVSRRKTGDTIHPYTVEPDPK